MAPPRFEMRLSEEEEQRLKYLAEREGLSGADLVRSLLRKTWRREVEDKLEALAHSTLTEMVGRPRVVSAAVFWGPPSSNVEPMPSATGYPRWDVSNTLTAPGIGVVVCCGFQSQVAERDQQIVTSRFPKLASAWSTNGWVTDVTREPLQLQTWQVVGALSSDSTSEQYPNVNLCTDCVAQQKRRRDESQLVHQLTFDPSLGDVCEFCGDSPG